VFIELTHATAGKKFKIVGALIKAVMPIECIGDAPHDSSAKTLISTEYLGHYHVRETPAAVMALIAQK
jgi:hypothetical protein